MNEEFEIKEDRCDIAKVKDIDFSIDEDEYKKVIRFWELHVEKQVPQDEEESEMIKFVFYNPQYYINKYQNKEQYAKLTCEFSTYAVITPDGVWHEKGKMGWFGMNSATPEQEREFELSYKEKFLDTANPEWTLAIVDCHI